MSQGNYDPDLLGVRVSLSEEFQAFYDAFRALFKDVSDYHGA